MASLSPSVPKPLKWGSRGRAPRCTILCATNLSHCEEIMNFKITKCRAVFKLSCKIAIFERLDARFEYKNDNYLRFFIVSEMKLKLDKGDSTLKYKGFFQIFWVFLDL